MTRVIPVALTIALAFVAGAQSPAQPSNTARYTKSEIKQLVHDAHTPEQYQALAQYFRSQQQADEQQAQTEKAEWERLSGGVTSAAAKYPRPADSSRIQYENLSDRAQQMGQRAEHYEELLAKSQH